MFQNLQVLSPDTIFQLNQEFNNDPSPQKINLGIGIYLDNNSQSYVHPTIQAAAQKIDLNNFNYNPIQGHSEFLKLSYQLLTDKEIPAPEHYTQAISGGTHGCYIISQLLQRANINTLLLPTPTWGNHLQIFNNLNLIQFPHLKNQEINFQEYINQIKSAPQNSALLIHGGLAHNPTGLNLNLDQLETIIEICNQKNIFLIQDFAYLGLSENFQTDKKYLNLILQKSNFASSIISFSKNATIYEHRTGILITKTSKDQTKQIKTNIQNIIRKNISQPSGFGQKILADVFKNSKQQWLTELEQMNHSIKSRQQLFQATFPNLTSQQTYGMFALLPLTPEKIQNLKSNHIYILPNGRINYGSLTPNIIQKLKNSF